MAETQAGEPKPKGIDWRYTATRRREFIAALAETYDVAVALERGKLTWAQVCELRARHPDFAERIEEVIAAGYDRIEIAMLAEAGAVQGSAVNAALAQALLKQRRMGKADAAIAQRRARGPAPTQDQQIKALVDRLAPLRAATRPGEGVTRGGATNGSKDAPPAGQPVSGAPAPRPS